MNKKATQLQQIILSNDEYLAEPTSFYKFQLQPSYEIILEARKWFNNEYFERLDQKLTSQSDLVLYKVNSVIINQMNKQTKDKLNEYTRYEVRNNNCFGETGAKEFVDALQKFSSLSSLSISEIKMNPKQISDLPRLLYMNQILTLLSLSFCQLRSTEVEILAHELEFNNRSVVSLNLSFNYIDKKGLKSISNALKINEVLTSVFMSGNDFVDQDLKPLLSVFPRNKTLCVFDLNFTPAYFSNGENLKLIRHLLLKNISSIKKNFS
eukprot:snap_masked-scaffold_23-processed-gene-4.16-mRNA-1 protein AED:1.00 eAED:1.00 QI:0/-1/0/0/-1/1/1/0/265